MPSTKFLSLLALAASAIATPTSLDSPTPGYAIEEARWEIEVAPGKLVTARGTIQQAVAEITARHDPEFEAKLLKRADDAPPTSSLAERSVLEARGTVNCAAQAQWAEANLQPIYDGVRYLRGLNGQTNQETGCKRVSCSYSGSIWLCNDNASNLKIGWGAVADAAYEVAETCHWCYGANNAPVCKVKGQGFQSGNWNVVVRAADC